MKKTLSSSRHIAGIFAEIESRRGLLFFFDKEKEEKQGSSTLTLELDSVTQEIRILLPLAPSPRLVCEVILLDKRITFELTECPAEGKKFALPEEIEISDLRESPRITLGKNAYPAEVRTPGNIILGFANDVAVDHVSIELGDFSGKPVPLAIGSIAEVIVRSKQGSTDIFYRKAKVVSLRIQDGHTQALFCTLPIESTEHIARPKRYKFSPHHIKYKVQNLKEANLNGKITVIDASLTGFSGIVEAKNLKQKPILGMILTSDDPRIQFCAVRKVGDTYGFSIVGSNDQNVEYTNWLAFIQTNAFSNLTEIVNPTEIAELLMESGFLKSARLKALGIKPEEHLPHVSQEQNLNLARRFIVADDGSHLSKNISLFRFTDHAWILHEVASGVHKSGSMQDLYTQVVFTVSDESKHLPNRPNFIAIYYNPKIEIVAHQWDTFNSGVGCTYFPTKLLSYNNIQDTPSNIEITSKNITEINSRKKAEIAQSYDDTLLDFLDFWNPGSPSPRLNNYLRDRGPSHSAELFIVEKTNSKAVLGISYRIKTNYATNSTGVINSLFLFPKKHITESDFTCLLSGVKNCSAQAIGTNDIVVVFQSYEDLKNISDILKNEREFKFLIANLKVISYDK